MGICSGGKKQPEFKIVESQELNDIIDASSPKVQTVFIKSNFHSQYIILSPPLGQGKLSEVRKVIHKTLNLTRAAKIIKKKNLQIGQDEQMINEVEILKSLDHPNIIKIFDFYEDEFNYYVITEICYGGELFDKNSLYFWR